MSEVAVLRFGCDGCGKQYPWKPELTNKKAKCKCGTTITVPDLSVPADEPPPLPDDGIFDFIDNAPEIASPSAAALRASVVAAPVAAPAAKTTKRGTPVLGYRQGPNLRDQTRAKDAFGMMHDMKRDVYVPTGLIVGSFLAYFAWLMFHGGATTGSSLAVYGAVMALMFAFKTFFMIIGAFIVASLASVSFGPFWTAILKLAAVAIAPDIFATIVEEAIGVPGAGLLAGALALGFYWFLISWLFSMDASEAWVVVVLFGVLRWILTFVGGMLLLALVTGGSAASIGIGGATRPPSDAAVELNENVANWKENDHLIEALAYIEKTNRNTDMTGPAKRLYAVGAKNVWFYVSRDINGKTEPGGMIAEWPKDPKKREAMLKEIHDMQATHAKNWATQHPDWGKLDVEEATDDGGKYIELPAIEG